VLAFSRSDPQQSRNQVLVVVNFNNEVQTLPVEALRTSGFIQPDVMKDLCTGARVEVENDALLLPALSCQWLTD
jgi:hypothetical protein